MRTISAGGMHGMALLGNGMVQAWGGNGAGQLGDGTETNRFHPDLRAWSVWRVRRSRGPGSTRWHC